MRRWLSDYRRRRIYEESHPRLAALRSLLKDEEKEPESFLTRVLGHLQFDRTGTARVERN
jgi:hypothetical protein